MSTRVVVLCILQSGLERDKRRKLASVCAIHKRKVLFFRFKAIVFHAAAHVKHVLLLDVDLRRLLLLPVSQESDEDVANSSLLL